MYFVLLVILATALLLAWWFMRKQAQQHVTVKRLSIAVTQGIAIVTLPAAYEVEDMGVLWEFIQGKEAVANRTRVHTLLYDCSEWRWSNVLGAEMALWQADADWTGDTIFCQLSPEMKSVLDLLITRENAQQQVEGSALTFRLCLYFASVEEGLAYAQAKQA